jgi:UDP-xylose/UDP-N-acetylglucosamine transporter B4
MSQSLSTLPSSSATTGASNVKTNLTKEEWKKRMSSLMEEDLSEDFDGASSKEPKEVSQETATPLSLPFALAFIGVVIGGVGANICFEKLNQLDPGCGAVITLLQYVVAVAERAPDATTYIKAPAIPYTFHILFCVLLFCGSWLGNTCLAFDLPFPLFLVIKNSNLVFTLIVGAIALGKRYSMGQIFAVVLVSAGVVMAVLEQQQSSTGGASDETSSKTLVGILLCAGATLCMACLSCAQEYTFGKYKLKNGKTATKEAMFFTHVLGLPFFISGGLWQHVIALAADWRVAVPLIVMNVASMVLCKTNIFRLIELSSSLTTTLAITFSRFLGIVISVCFLSSSNQNNSSQQPGLQFWLGALAVVAGSISYLMVGQQKPKSKQA